jgi:hypothetical protein
MPLADGTILTTNNFIEDRECLPSVYYLQNFHQFIVGDAFSALTVPQWFLFQM